jgi:hypothetical protein
MVSPFQVFPRTFAAARLPSLDADQDWHGPALKSRPPNEKPNAAREW